TSAQGAPPCRTDAAEPCLSAVCVSQAADQTDQSDAHQQPRDLGGSAARGQALLQLWNQVGQRYIDEAAAGHGQEIGQVVVQPVDQPPAGQAAQSGDGARERNLDQRSAPVGTGEAQHGVVADVVR